PRIRFARRVNVDRVRPDHVAAEHHRLEEQAAAAGENAGGGAEHLAVDLILPSGPELRGRAEMLEGADAGDAIETTESVTGDGAAVVEMHVEAVAAARGPLAPRQRHADPGPATRFHIPQQPTPAAPHVERALPGDEPQLLPHERVLAALRLLQSEREVAVVLGATEVSGLADAQPEDLVDQGVGEIDVALAGHASSGPRN